jgi:CelD/BcsL family acetyltransferase involved in cellulose biosynthesis
MQAALDLITSSAKLQGLRPEWEELCRRCPAATPFQSPAWLLPWWRVFGTTEPRVMTVRQQGRLVGLLPLYILDEQPARKLLTIGAGLTDYQDLLLDPELPGETADLLLQSALSAACTDGITEFTLPELPPHSTLRTAAIPAGWKELPTTTTPCPILQLPTSVDDLHNTIPAGKRRDLRQSLHRAERIGGWITEIATGATLDSFLSALLRLHAAHWPSADPRIAAFLRHAAPELLEAGFLRLQILRFGNTIAAGYFVLQTGDRMMFYVSGFDSAFAAQAQEPFCWAT